MERIKNSDAVIDAIRNKAMRDAFADAVAAQDEAERDCEDERLYCEERLW